MMLFLQKKILLLLICSLTFQGVFAQNNEPTAKEIIERHLEAIGGREAINKIKTIEFADKIYTSTDTLLFESKVIIGKAAYSENKEDSTYIIARDNMAIVKDKGQIIGTIFSTMMEAIGREKNFQELNFLSSKYIIKYSGQGKVNDSVWAHQITISDFKGVIQTRAYDKKTGLLVLKLSKMGQLSYYSDYREVGGVLFPFKVNLGEANETIVQYVKVNEEFDEAIFEWNDEQDKRMIGSWVHKTKTEDKKDIPFLELSLEENRNGEYKTGYFDVEGDKILDSRLPILGWQLYEDTLMVQIVDVGQLLIRYFKMEDKTENSFTGRPVKIEFDEVPEEEKEIIKSFKFDFRREEK